MRLTRQKKTTKQKPRETHVIVVLDESGSMHTCASRVREGVNSYVEQIKNDGNVYAGMMVIKFNRSVTLLCRSVPLLEVPVLDESNYVPGDLTALYDAIARGLSEAERWGTEDYPYGTDKFIFVILTDGHENASIHYDRKRILEEIRKRQEAGNWTFVYLEADIDAWGKASELGISAGNTIRYTGEHSEVAFAALASSTIETASAGDIGQTHTFFGKTTRDLTTEHDHQSRGEGKRERSSGSE